uniref:Si:ch211-213a13.2 n=1 Tax=Sinocyclocheilus grahami TaxID=75366 RepID=A0A672L8N6_SINGR
MKDLDMSNNNLQDSGVKKLQNGLENTNCTLEKLRLNKCNLTDKSCSALAAVLGSDTNLKELNMNNNNLQDSGVKLLCSGLKSVKCELEILRLSNCCSALTSALKSNPSHLRELSLSENKLGDSGVKNLSDLLMNPQCKLEILHLCECSITEEQCLILTSALKSNPSHLRELDLSENKIENKGVNYLSFLIFYQKQFIHFQYNGFIHVLNVLNLKQIFSFIQKLHVNADVCIKSAF